jgi:hypothetical protein
LVDHGLYDIRCQIVPRWFGYFPLQDETVARIRNAVGPAQLAFEDNDEAYLILTKIFAYLQQDDKLEAIYIRLKDGEKHPIAGLPHVFRSMGIDKSVVDSKAPDAFNKHAANQGLGPHFQQGDLPASLYYVTKYSGFNKQILHFKPDNTHVKHPETLPSEQRWVLASVWPHLALPAVQSITTIEATHLHTCTSTVNEYLSGTIAATTLTIHGAPHCIATCPICTGTPCILLSTSFPNLSILALQDLFFASPKQLITLLSSLPTLHSLSLSFIMLKLGSFEFVFTTWASSHPPLLLPLLTKLTLDQLMEQASGSAPSWWYVHGGRRDRGKVVLEGCRDCVRGRVGRMAAKFETGIRKPLGMGRVFRM